jgi:hypothetical protein
VREPRVFAEATVSKPVIPRTAGLLGEDSAGRRYFITGPGPPFYLAAYSSGGQLLAEIELVAQPADRYFEGRGMKLLAPDGRTSRVTLTDTHVNITVYSLE